MALPEVTSETLQIINGWLKATGELVKEQAPEVVRQILSYELYSSILWMAIPFVIIVACVFIWVKVSVTIEKDQSSFSSDAALNMFFYILITVIIIISVFIFASNTMDLLKVITAPKLVILEYIKSYK